MKSNFPFIHCIYFYEMPSAFTRARFSSLLSKWMSALCNFFNMSHSLTLHYTIVPLLLSLSAFAYTQHTTGEQVHWAVKFFFFFRAREVFFFTVIKSQNDTLKLFTESKSLCKLINNFHTKLFNKDGLAWCCDDSLNICVLDIIQHTLPS